MRSATFSSRCSSRPAFATGLNQQAAILLSERIVVRGANRFAAERIARFAMGYSVEGRTTSAREPSAGRFAENALNCEPRIGQARRDAADFRGALFE